MPGLGAGCFGFCRRTAFTVVNVKGARRAVSPMVPGNVLGVRDRLCGKVDCVDSHSRLEEIGMIRVRDAEIAKRVVTV